MKKMNLILSSIIACLIVFLPTLSLGASLMMKGDGNGDGKITPTDSLLAKKFVLGQITLTDEQKAALDVNNDNQITMEDVNLILDIYYGRIKEFPNHPPSVVSSIADHSAIEGEASISVELSDVFSDQDKNPLTYQAASDRPDVASVQVNGAQLSITPLSVGTAVVTVTADDGKGGTIATSFTMTVGASNHSPEATTMVIPHQVIGFGVTGNQISIEGAFQDQDGDSLTYRVTSADQNLVQASISGNILSLTPVQGGRGTSIVTVTADDGKGGTVSKNFSVSTVQVVHQQQINTKIGVAQLSYDLAPYFPGKTAFTVYTQTPGVITNAGSQSLNGTVFTSASVNGAYWVVADDGTTAYFEVKVNPQSGSNVFFTEYLDAGNGRAALEIFGIADESAGMLTGYEVEVHQYHTDTARTTVSSTPLYPFYPNMTCNVIDPMFYDLFDVANVWYYNAEVVLSEVLSPTKKIVPYALVLKKDGQVLDIIGNTDPIAHTPIFANGGTMVRKQGIVTGSTKYEQAGEWDLYPSGSFQFYGRHTP